MKVLFENDRIRIRELLASDKKERALLKVGKDEIIFRSVVINGIKPIESIKILSKRNKKLPKIETMIQIIFSRGTEQIYSKTYDSFDEYYEGEQKIISFSDAIGCIDREHILIITEDMYKAYLIESGVI